MLVGQFVEAIHGQRKQNQLDDFILELEEAVAELEEFVGMAALHKSPFPAKRDSWGEVFLPPVIYAYGTFSNLPRPGGQNNINCKVGLTPYVTFKSDPIFGCHLKSNDTILLQNVLGAAERF